MNLKAFLVKAVEARGDATLLRFKAGGHWRTVSYREFLARVRRVTELLASARVAPGDRVALHHDNSPEWPEIYFGIVSLGATVVPVDTSLQEQEIAHALRDSGSQVIFTGAHSYATIRQLESHLPMLDRVILIGGQEVLPVASNKLVYEDYEASLALSASRAASGDSAFSRFDPKDDDVASLIYTSGTTGRQKGAMLTHRNFTANVEGALQAIRVRTTDNFLLVLPLHHAFAFTGNLLVPIGAGCEISFVESIKTIGESMAETRPTVLLAVPLLLEKMYRKVEAGLRQKKIPYLLTKLGLGRMVGRKVVSRLGGRLRAIITGGAPCDPDILRGWFALGIPVLEGYGLTETAPILTLNPEAAPRIGTVGKALPGVELKIVEPDAQGIGEIAARGPNIMPGYYNDPGATRHVVEDGWLLTGDLGFIDRDGYLTVSGRKKSLIVNREGRNIYPEEVECQVLRSPYILEALCLGYRAPGETTGERVGLIVVPNQETIDDRAARDGLSLDEREIEALIQSEVKRLCAEIADYKRPRSVQVRFEEFEKTSTQKVKRYLYAIDSTRLQDSGAAAP